MVQSYHVTYPNLSPSWSGDVWNPRGTEVKAKSVQLAIQVNF
jgi:hypothetical protein